ncbi:MAG: hypothetical protein MI747_22990 [Desulfobacterales bacterium]|nr:hypothetical protein [Desulfobacterales bacterium]
MKLRVVLANSLLCLLEDAGTTARESCVLDMDEPCTPRDVLAALGISPLLVPMILAGQTRVTLDTELDGRAALTLHGPLAGG